VTLPAADVWDLQKQATESQSHWEKNSSRTDLANSNRLVRKIKDQFLWVDPWNCWMKYNQGKWGEDRSRGIHRKAKTISKIIYSEASILSSDEAKEHAKWGIKSQSSAHIKNMVELAKSEVAVEPDKFDQQDKYLNLLNGTLDLTSYELLTHNAAHYLTQQTEIEYDPEATCPKFHEFLRLIFGFDTERIETWQVIFGACLEGEQGFERFFIVYGTGANGKTTLLNVLCRLLGDYSKTAASSVFTTGKDDAQGFNKHSIKGARVVTAAEVRKGARLNLAEIKQMTGGDPIRSAAKFKDSEEWTPKHHIFFSSNNKPVVNGQDEGTRRRLTFMELKNKIPASKRRPMEDVLAELMTEASGILNWAIQGHKRYKSEGLQIPRTIQLANEAFMAEQDILAEWIEKYCVLGDDESEMASVLRESYNKSCEETGLDTLKPLKFAQALEEKDLSRVRVNKGTIWKGISLISGRVNTDSQTESGRGYEVSEKFLSKKEPHVKEPENFATSATLPPLSANQKWIETNQETGKQEVHERI